MDTSPLISNSAKTHTLATNFPCIRDSFWACGSSWSIHQQLRGLHGSNAGPLCVCDSCVAWTFCEAPSSVIKACPFLNRKRGGDGERGCWEGGAWERGGGEGERGCWEGSIGERRGGKLWSMCKINEKCYLCKIKKTLSSWSQHQRLCFCCMTSAPIHPHGNLCFVFLIFSPLFYNPMSSYNFSPYTILKLSLLCQNCCLLSSSNRWKVGIGMWGKEGRETVVSI